jgi:hypothetical protein
MIVRDISRGPSIPVVREDAHCSRIEGDGDVSTQTWNVKQPPCQKRLHRSDHIPMRKKNMSGKMKKPMRSTGNPVKAGYIIMTCPGFLSFGAFRNTNPRSIFLQKM